MLKLSLFNTVPYVPPEPAAWPWPISPSHYDKTVGQLAFDDALATCELVEDLGFDWVSVSEHHYSQSMSPNPLVMAAAVAQRTTRIKVALLGVTVPLTNPVRVAEEFGIVDNLSHGRLIAGMLRGTPNEFVTYGTNPAETRALYEEGVELILRAWAEPEPFGWLGTHYEFRVVSVWPQPVQQPRPPVFVSANSPDAGAFAARIEVGAGVSYQPLPVAAKSFAHFRSCAEQAGWTPSRDECLYRCFIHVAESDAQAVDDLETIAMLRGRGAIFNVNARVGAALAAAEGRAAPGGPGGLRPGPNFCGGPETVARQIREFVEATGVGIIDFTFVAAGASRDLYHKSLELVGARVAPLVRDL